MGFVIYGPDGEKLRRWSTNEDEKTENPDGEDGDTGAHEN
jgi:hypothetical protein